MSIENLDFRINAAIDAGNSAKTLGELKTSLKELRDLAAQAGPENTDQFIKLSTAAGEVNDKIKDVRESVQALSGTPMERLGNSFSRLRQSIFEMDLEKFKLSLIGIKDSFIALGAQALSPFKALGSAMIGLVAGTTSLTAAMRALGGAIAATGIGALVVAVGLLITYWDKLETSGGLVGRTFNAVKSTIDGALTSLQKFAELLGLIGPSASKTAGGGVSPTGEREITPKDKELYEREKRLQEERISRVEYARKIAKEQVDDEIRLAKTTITNKEELAKKEDELIKKRLNQETKYLSDIEKMNEEWLRRSVRFNLLNLGIPEAKQLDELNKQREDLVNQLAQRPVESRGVFIERVSKVESQIAEIDKEIKVVEDRVDRASRIAAKMVTDYVSGVTNAYKFQFAGVTLTAEDFAKTVDDITLDAGRKVAGSRYELKKLTTEQQISESERQMNQTQDAKEEQRRAAEIAAANRDRRKKEAEDLADRLAKEDLSRTQQLEKNAQTQLRIQEDYNRSGQEIDDMYAQIAQEGRLKTSEEIYAEIDKRLAYQMDASIKAFQNQQQLDTQLTQNKATQFDLENLMISRNHDVFTEEMDYRVVIDNMYADIQAQNATWTSEMIYEEIRRRLQFQIDAYDAEKQAAIDKTNAIIDTARYGAQALDGINQFLYTLDENRRISGEMSEKSMAQRAFNRNKSLGIINAAINTAAGVTAVLASPTNKIDPTGTLQAIQIGFVIATGLAQIATIASQRFDANSFSSGGGNNNITAPSEQATVDTGQFLDTGEFKAGDPRERRVYVVESDITGIQRKVQVIENRSKF